MLTEFSKILLALFDDLAVGSTVGLRQDVLRVRVSEVPEIKSSEMVTPVSTPVSPVCIVKNRFFFGCRGRRHFLLFEKKKKNKEKKKIFFFLCVSVEGELLNFRR